jgi:hypothetical protein
MLFITSGYRVLSSCSCALIVIRIPYDIFLGKILAGLNFYDLDWLSAFTRESVFRAPFDKNVVPIVILFRDVIQRYRCFALNNNPVFISEFVALITEPVSGIAKQSFDLGVPLVR